MALDNVWVFAEATDGSVKTITLEMLAKARTVRADTMAAVAEGLTAEPAGLLKFAGEHTDSFYSWQGYMEGACLSGVRAAGEVLADINLEI